MNDKRPDSIVVENSIENIGKKNWNNCANHEALSYNPFVSYEFLNALEKSNSVNGDSGWYTSFFVAKDKDDKIIGCTPAYLKNNSSGEYVFDYSWAEAYQRVGRSYYPKLQISIPFTPVSTPKLLTKDQNDIDTKVFMLQAIEDFCSEHAISSAHLTFLNEKELNTLQNKKWLIRTDQQFHWFNDNYNDFNDFLSDLSSRKRKNIKKERDEANKNGLVIETLNHKEIQEFHWDEFYKFYIDTSMRKWGQPYLNRDFFSLIGQTLSENILLIMVKNNNKYIAGALNFIGGDTIYGRNWGCIEDHKNLHFEVCYYRAIDFAINNKLKKVEAGAQGAHKISRGYQPSKTFSAHWIKDIDFFEAISNYLKDERVYIQENIEKLNEYIPFKKNMEK
ncbi:MAG: GNAT family N-acetyltransferase [Pseudomonadota bacterium]|nr:GNAT family N-acetyltransferase [Pseudomonadota bacterium]MED5253392.1 GNAT family N-acetyltransferase [Pseudomonadota bacterium]MED5272998.1 GNAT family N-acetyltransferase [Pseudomonadota bacterium]MED5484620.1 GNAT family N-acetyltransferase [Pseudomonadota bacterium]|tara:strand:- start:1750 stop:2922 length:1173 start_codon:yes stop_codon:yes gene_type:complete